MMINSLAHPIGMECGFLPYSDSEIVESGSQELAHAIADALAELGSEDYVSPTSVFMATTIANCYPFWLKLPDVDISRYGEVVFEWFVNPYRFCSIVFGSDGILYVNEFKGKYTRHPWAEPFRDEFPESVERALKKLGFQKELGTERRAA